MPQRPEVGDIQWLQPCPWWLFDCDLPLTYAYYIYIIKPYSNNMWVIEHISYTSNKSQIKLGIAEAPLIAPMHMDKLSQTDTHRRTFLLGIFVNNKVYK